MLSPISLDYHSLKKKYKATGNVENQLRRPVNKKIIPEKHDQFDNIKHVYEFSILQIARLRTSHFKMTSSETEVSELD